MTDNVYTWSAPVPSGESLGDPCSDKTRADLEYDRVLAALGDRCASSAGRRLALALPFLPTHAAVLKALQEVREALSLDEEGDPLPSGDLPELDTAIERARIGAALSNEELRAVAACLTAAGALRRFLQSRRQRAAALFDACATDPSLDDLARELSSCFDPDGTLSDRSSPRLATLRAEARTLRDRLVRKLEELMHKHEDILQDAYWTERDGRYVLPVRSDAHERFPGIVHATSSSGATVFVEPRHVVDLGNRRKMLDAQISREENLVYAALSVRVAESVESIAAAVQALSHADVRAAICRLSKDLRLCFADVPAPGETPTIELVSARHPLLVLDGVDVVPSDLRAASGRAIVISGPNAGGKTVALKTLGLTALMVRAGLPVPAADGSRVSVFEVVLTDVGDDQNLSKNLSTFSAHVQNLSRILDETRRGALVLLDELAGGTDPREGEALAAAVLDSLCARGGAAACTTHYEGLKVLALGDPRFENASVGFDMATMSPTFRLSMGVPGASSALAVARRFGIPAPLLDRAERFLSRDVATFDEMVEKLQAERRALELAREAADREAQAARQRRADLDRELERLAAKDRTAVTREGQALLDSLRRAREDLRAAQARLRSGHATEQDIRTASRQIDAVAQKTAIGGELEPKAEEAGVDRPAVDPSEIRVGSRVYVPRLRAEADVMEILSSGQLRVAAGPLKLTTTIAEIRACKPAAAGSTPAQGRAGRPEKRRVEYDAAADPDVPIQTSDNTVDLRGLRAHEAIALAEQFLDRSLGAGRRVAFLIHGHGTGALRDALRSELRNNVYVTRSRPGEPREGGDGVTVVWLRS